MPQVSVLIIELWIRSRSHMLSVSSLTCWQYAVCRGGILNDSLKWESNLTLNVGLFVAFKSKRKKMIHGTIKTKCLLVVIKTVYNVIYMYYNVF